MTRTLRWSSVSLLALVISACGDQNPDTAGGPDAPVVQDAVTQVVRSAPGDAPTGPEQDRAEITERDDLAQARAQRQQLRDRREAERGWWNDEELISHLGLDAQQHAELLAARQALAALRLQTRTQLMARRSSGPSAEGVEQADGPTALHQNQDDARAQMEQATQSWHRAVREILTVDQLESLRERDPASVPALR